MNDGPTQLLALLNKADLGMVLLCSFTAFCLLASPLVPYEFDLGTASGAITFLLADLLISALLSATGIALNHLARRNMRISFRRRGPR